MDEFLRQNSKWERGGRSTGKREKLNIRTKNQGCVKDSSHAVGAVGAAMSAGRELRKQKEKARHESQRLYGQRTRECSIEFSNALLGAWKKVGIVSLEQNGLGGGRCRNTTTRRKEESKKKNWGFWFERDISQTPLANNSKRI